MHLIQNAVMKNREQLMQDTYSWLQESSSGSDLADLVARMLSSQVSGNGDMPRWLGLTRVEFNRMMQYLYPGQDTEQFSHYGKELDIERSDEHSELRELFLSHAAGDALTFEWVADILVAGCMGGDHLWQDLGMWSRKDLTALIRSAFAPLADKNVHDMKWKKFFYKQLCIQEGIYTCRAPSCQVCADYANCFGPE